MRALRAPIALLLSAVVALAAGTSAARSFVPVVPGHAALVAEAGSIDRSDSPPLTYIAKTSPPGGVAEVDPNGRGPGPSRTPRPAAPAVPVHHDVPARIAAVDRSVLAFQHALSLARSGWFFFATTTPPPFRV
jgi:hypothetical protein